MVLTKHALERMQERNISEEQVQKTLDSAKSAKPSKHTKGVYVTESEIGNRTLSVVFNPVNSVVLTAYWGSKKKGANNG